MWQALAQMGSQLMMNRHQDMFNRKAANVAFDREVMMKNWDVQLANSAHQREVADLRSAGLNPILSASKGGGGAVVPASSHVPQAAGVSGGSGIDFAGSSAKSAQANLAAEQGSLVKAQVDESNARSAHLKAQEADVWAGIDTHGYQRLKLAEEAGLFRASAAAAEQGIEKSKQDIRESAQRIKHLIQLDEESKSKVQLNKAEIPRLMEDISLIRQRAKLTAQESEKLDAALIGLRVEGLIDQTMYAEVLRILKRITSTIVPW